MASHAATATELGHHHGEEEHPPPVIWSAKTPINLMGMLFFIGSEIALFGSFFMAYFFLRVVGDADYQSWAETIGHAIPLKVATINSLILFSSSVTIHWAEICLKRSARGWQAIWLAATLLLGIAFMSIQVLEYSDLVAEQVGPTKSAYSSVFFSITGLHGSHVLVGAILLAVMLVRTLRGHYGPGSEQHVGFRSMAVYWHFVDLVWVFVFSLLYLPGKISGDESWADEKVFGLTGPVAMGVGVAVLLVLAFGMPKLLGKEAPKH